MPETTVILYDIENSPLEMLEYALVKAQENFCSSHILVYSDWTVCSKKKKWQDFFHRQEADFIQIGRKCSGKNALDKALFESALSLLDKNRKHFIIVTSDTDFLKLAQELHKSADTHVIGIGCNTKDEKLKEVYDRFYCYEAEAAQSKPLPELKGRTEAEKAAEQQLRLMFEETAEGREWVPLSEIGDLLKRQYAKFRFPKGYPKQLKKIFLLHEDRFAMQQQDKLASVRIIEECLPEAPRHKSAAAAAGERPQAEIREAAVLPQQAKMAVKMDENAVRLRQQWKMAVLMLHEGVDEAVIQKVADIPAGEMADLRDLLQRLKR